MLLWKLRDFWPISGNDATYVHSYWGTLSGNQIRSIERRYCRWLGDLSRWLQIMEIESGTCCMFREISCVAAARPISRNNQHVTCKPHYIEMYTYTVVLLCDLYPPAVRRTTGDWVLFGGGATHVPKMVRFTWSREQNVPNYGAGVHAVPRSAV